MTQTFDFLTGREAEFIDKVMPSVRGNPWADAILAEIARLGGPNTESLARLFELQFGLRRTGVTLSLLWEESAPEPGSDAPRPQ